MASTCKCIFWCCICIQPFLLVALFLYPPFFRLLVVLPSSIRSTPSYMCWCVGRIERFVNVKIAMLCITNAYELEHYYACDLNKSGFFPFYLENSTSIQYDPLASQVLFPLFSVAFDGLISLYCTQL